MLATFKTTRLLLGLSLGLAFIGCVGLPRRRPPTEGIARPTLAQQGGARDRVPAPTLRIPADPAPVETTSAPAVSAPLRTPAQPTSTPKPTLTADATPSTPTPTPTVE